MNGVLTLSSANEGEVVRVNFGVDFYDRDFYYISEIAGNTNSPYDDTAAVISPLPVDGWKIMEAGYVYPEVLSIENITQLAEPPTQPPLVIYTSNEELTTNRLKSAMWQFKYKYVYADGQESAWSPISKTPLPSSLVNPLDTAYVEDWRDNQINVSLSISDNALIKSIKVASRRVFDSKSPEDFFLHNEIFTDDISVQWDNVGVGSGIVDVFTNKEDRLAIELTDSNQLFYYVPKKSKALTLTGDNRIVHGNCEIGYDVDSNLITTDVPDLTVEYNDAEVIAPLTVPSIVGFDSVQSLQTYTMFDVDDLSIGNLNAGDVIRFEISGLSVVIEEDTGNPFPEGFPNNGTSRFSLAERYVVQKADVDSLSQPDLKQKVAFDIGKLLRAQYIKEFGYRNAAGNTKNKNVSRHHIYGGSSGTEVTFEIAYLRETTVSDTYWVKTTVDDTVVSYNEGGTITNRSPKRGSSQTFGLVYSDRLGRVSTVVTSDRLSANIDWYYNQASITENGLATMDLKINHIAPDWATKCHIVKKIDNGITRFVQVPLSINNTSVGDNLTKFFVNGLIDSNGTAEPNNALGAIETVCIYLNALNGDGVQAYNEIVPNSVLSYSFTKGDRIRFIGTADGSEWYDDDVEILGYNDTFNYVIINKGHLNQNAVPSLYDLLDSANETAPSPAAGTLFEIYTPQNEETLKGYYYETGISLDVINGVHVGTDGELQDYNNGIPAYVALDCGDSYYKTRWYNIGDSALLEQYYMLEDYNFNDAFDSKVSNVGRFNLKTQVDSEEGSDDRSGQAQQSQKLNTLFYSQPYIQGTDINRLGSIYDISFKDTDASFNSIQKLHSDGDRIKIFQEDRVGFAYNSRYVSTSLGGQNTLSSGATAPAISDIQYYQYRGGISLNPESHVYYEGKDYFFDLRRGNICRLTNNGIDPISEKGVDAFTKNVSDLMLSGAEKDIAIGAIDRRNQEYLLNFKWTELSELEVFFTVSGGGETADFYYVLSDEIYRSQFTVGETRSTETTQTIPSGILDPNDLWKFDYTVNRIDGDRVYGNFVDTYVNPVLKNDYKFNLYSSNVISFSDKLNVWNSFYSYIPDYIESAGMDLVSWKDGNLYAHNSDSVTPMNFYGEQHDGEIAIVSSVGDPINVKTPTTIEIQDNSTYELSGDTEVMDWDTVEDGIETETSQVSDLQTSDFSFREGKAYAALLRDKNTPNLTYPLLDGDKLKGTWTSIRLRLNGGFLNIRKVTSVSIRQFLSFFAQ